MRFKRVYVEIMNSCNLKCSFCIGNQRKPQMMDAKQFYYVAKQLRPYTEYLYLHVLGEPLMHPQLKEILEICDAFHFQVQITSNGTLLSKQKDILKQAKALRQINISLHSFFQHKEIDMIQYLQSCFDVGEELKEHIYLSYRLWNKQHGEIDMDTQAIVDWINKRYHTNLAPQGILGSDKYTLQKNMFLNFEEMFAWPTLHHAFVDNPAKCLGWKQMCAILVNGDVVPCCLDGNGACVLGNLFHTDFKEIVESVQGNQILEGWKQNMAVEELCKHCSYRLRFTNRLQ